MVALLQDLIVDILTLDVFSPISKLARLESCVVLVWEKKILVKDGTVMRQVGCSYRTLGIKHCLGMRHAR